MYNLQLSYFHHGIQSSYRKGTYIYIHREVKLRQRSKLIGKKESESDIILCLSAKFSSELPYS